MLLRCSEPLPTRGALGFSTDSPTANDFATAPALQGLARTTLPVAPARSWSAPASRDCSGGRWGLSPKEATASYLAARLRANPDGIPYTAGGVDVGTTANAVLGLVAAGTARGQVRAGLQVLRAQARAFVVSSGRTVPGSAALLTLVAHATHGNPRSFAGLDLVQRIRGSIRP